MKRSAVIAAVRSAARALAVLAFTAGCGMASAGDIPQFAVPAAQNPTAPAFGTLRVALAMCLVLGALFATAWLTRRLRGGMSAGAGALQVLAQVSLGARERAVLLRVGAQQILVGVAAGNVRTLHVLDTDAADAGMLARPPPAEAGRPSFKSMLLRSLGK